MFSVACYVGFASCKTFGKQPKRPCFGRGPKLGEGGSPTLSPARTPGVYAQMLYARTHTSGRTKSVQDAPTTNDHDCTDAEPTKHTQPFPGKGVFGKDAEIRTRRALHEAKPSECPKGDRDNKSEVYFKNRLLLIVVNLTTTSFFGIFPD